MNNRKHLLSSSLALALVVLVAPASASNPGSANTASAGPDVAPVVQPMALGDVDQDLVYTPVTPCRLLDTRIAGGIFTAASTRDFIGFTDTDFASQGGSDTDCGIPIDAAAISVNLAMVNPVQAGFATAYPFGEERPLAASINFVAGSTLSNEIVIPLAQGEESDFSLYSHRQAHAVADVSGYYMRPQATQLDCTYVEETRVIEVGATYAGPLACPAGYGATGGACSANGILATARDLIVTASEPSIGSGAAWWCQVYNDGAVTRQMRHMARCCRVPGR